MIATVIAVVATSNLAIGVMIGVVLSALFFAMKVQRVMTVHSAVDENAGMRTYFVRGQVFFASSEALVSEFDFKEPIGAVRVDVTHAHFWDITAIDALDRIVEKLRRNDIRVEVLGLNRASATMIEKYARHDKGNAAAAQTGH
jgi:SulP family sulfate permease